MIETWMTRAIEHLRRGENYVVLIVCVSKKIAVFEKKRLMQRINALPERTTGILSDAGMRIFPHSVRSRDKAMLGRNANTVLEVER